MKIIQSLWSKPSMLSSKTDRSQGGWREVKYFYMSWVLSCLSLKENYNHIKLITDKKGHELLIKKLKLPYEDIKIELDGLNHYPKNLWALGKLYSYSIQKEPFIHVDGDVFIWNKFGKVIENAPLIAQHLDTDEEGHYSEALRQMRNNNFILHSAIKKDLVQYNKIRSSNAGIIGGHDLEFFEIYCREAFNFIRNNLNNSKSDYTGTSYALLYEQYLYSCLARKAGKKITFYLDSAPSETDFNVSAFQNKYFKKYKYVHISASHKMSLVHCYELQNQLQVEFPNYYDLILKLIYDKELPN